MSDRQKIKDIFNKWALAHPSPNSVFYDYNGVTKTVAEFACEVACETPLANSAFLDIYEQKVKSGELSLQQIERAFTHH
ncbi:MAG: hypothetical protein CL561_11670 [Alphaproteobacteria bacterium]|nr:hypothetical protein [Alphaproteobacteria bacterium]|tara:strand:- start:567 stop:803 length:237 start_codon:yes stop_codon:yes gene_type:complete